MERGYPISLLDRSRRQKYCAGSVDGNICDLPDCILSHILSFLPIKNAMATSILSQRWKFLWTMTNNLDFRINHDEIDQHVRFVNHVLLLHKPGYLNRLSLTWHSGCIPYYVNTWISAAVLRNVHELFVHIAISKLPRSMFRSESLRSLELMTCKIGLSNEIVVSLPSLQSLRLISVSFDSEEALCKILGGCPVLKSLCIEIDIIRTMEHCGLHIDNGIEFKCIISSKSLRRLEVCSYEAHVDPPTLNVQLDAPFLEYIKLDQISSISIHQSLVFLVEAIIELVYLRPIFKSQNYYNSVAKAIHSVKSVKTLTLSPDVIKALSHATTKMETRFNNLTKLEVTRVRNWSSLGEFLTLADCLEVLTVNTDDCESNRLGKAKDHIGSKSDLVPRCFSNSLRTVSVDDFSGFEDEVASVGYILKHGNVLQVVHLRFCCCDVEAQYKVVKEISKFPRKSPICEVEFHDC